MGMWKKRKERKDAKYAKVINTLYWNCFAIRCY